MPTKNLPNKIVKIIEKSQIAEITEHFVYHKIAKITKNKKNRELLVKIWNEELLHYDIWKQYTQKEVKPNKFKMNFYYYLTRIFGLTFGLKLMERWEKNAQKNYKALEKYIPETVKIQEDEKKHEEDLLDMLDEKYMNYLGSIVLWLNDALVELTWVLAWLTLGLQDPKIIAVVGMITWVSASFSMAWSEYLSTKTDWSDHPLKSAIYTWVAYFLTVVLLILPYFLVNNIYFALLTTIWVSIVIIFVFNFYVSVSKGYNFKKRFLEMVSISLWVAVLSFFLGLWIRHFFGVEI